MNKQMNSVAQNTLSHDLQPRYSTLEFEHNLQQFSENISCLYVTGILLWSY